MNRKKKRKKKSDHYNLRNREKTKKNNFAGGSVREGGNALLVVGVTRAVYERAHSRIYAFRFCDFEGCSGPIFVLKVAKSSSCPPLKMCCLEIFVSQKLTNLWGSIPHRFTSKLW